MAYKEGIVKDFVDKTYSKEPAPGGGGVSAMTASLGCALAGMVSNFTTGKKKYVQYESDIQRILIEAKKLQDRLLDLIDEDEKNFVPLSKAYGIKAETDVEKAAKAFEISRCSIIACKAPVEIIELCYMAAKLHEELFIKGSKMLLSDVGVGVQCIKSAVNSAFLNILINIGSIEEEKFITGTFKKCKKLTADTNEICDDIYKKVYDKLNYEVK